MRIVGKLPRRETSYSNFMSSSTKRKAPHLSEEDTAQDTAYETCAQPAKEKQECVPNGADRHSLPTITREPDPS